MTKQKLFRENVCVCVSFLRKNKVLEIPLNLASYFMYITHLKTCNNTLKQLLQLKMNPILLFPKKKKKE